MVDTDRSTSRVPGERLPGPDDDLVVGIGGSAGGVRALKQFFGAVKPGAGMSYVVILHLSPDHESNLAQVLQANTAIPITQVTERVRVETDHAYVVSPNRRLTLEDGHIQTTEMSAVEERRAPVDMFFRALAGRHAGAAVSVILSGTGADGSMGMKRVKEEGGLCIAQEPGEADFGDMPRNAIATGLVDYVLPAQDMPGRLRAYRNHFRVVSVPAPDETTARDQALVDIFTHMRVRTGHDFSNYKRSTVLRRIERRMVVHGLETLAAYAAFLKENRDEPRALLKDLLISVTNFFRDPESFAALEQKVVPKLFQGKGPNDHVRVWVAGCATGEEAYSIAMLLAEYAPDPTSGPTVQVFATDIDEAALGKARTGLYTLNDAADVSPDRLRRFFVKDGDDFRVRRELREMVLFAGHNVIKDPPFSHLDMVTCRNLLIYLNRSAQERVVKLFHFGLKPGGYLFLGNSESAEEIANLFVSVEKDHHIFQSRGVETPLSLPPVSATPQPMVAANVGEIPGQVRLRERISLQEMHQRLLEQYAPPSLVVNRDWEIVHLTERAGRFLQFVGGEPSQSLLRVVRPELRLELHTALQHAVQNATNTEAVAGPLTLDGRSQMVRLLVNPVLSETDPSRGMILVMFEAAEAPVGAKPARISDTGTDGEPLARQLDEELVRLRLQMRTTIEGHELQQEELKASNEELQAMNEELRSSSEELETSKEELQSVNEELTTVNQELKIKIDELSHANNDTLNLMNSTDIATVFVDATMRVKLFTPQARTIFNLIAGDAGRSLLDITHKLDYPELAADIQKTLDTLAVGDREVSSQDGRWYIVRVLPYRTAENRISGVVLTFTDFTERRRIEQALRESDERVRLMVESVPEFAIFTLDLEGRIDSWNAAARELFGYGEKEVIGKPVDLLFTEEDRASGVPQQEMRQAREAGRAPDERWHRRKDGSRFFVNGVMAPLVRNGQMVGYTKVARDLTEKKGVEQALTAAHEELEKRVVERTRELGQANEALRREVAERKQSEEERVRLLRQLVTAQEEERRRISRELHDQLGQEVTALGLNLAVLKKSPELAPATRAKLESLEHVVKQLDSDVDFLVWELRPTGLDDLGLAEALADYSAGWSSYFGVRAIFNSTLSGRLSHEVETVLYRIAQEALNNAAKYARAKAVRLTLREEGKKVILEIADDGQGFDASKVDSKTVGLTSMRERAALVGGTTRIESTPGKGTRVHVEVTKA